MNFPFGTGPILMAMLAVGRAIFWKTPFGHVLPSTSSSPPPRGVGLCSQDRLLALDERGCSENLFFVSKQVNRSSWVKHQDSVVSTKHLEIKSFDYDMVHRLHTKNNNIYLDFIMICMPGQPTPRTYRNVTPPQK